MRNGETFPVNKCSAPGVCGKRKILATRKSNADSNGEVSINSGKRRDKSSAMRDGRKELTRVVKANHGHSIQQNPYVSPLSARVILSAVRKIQENKKI
jgi:hypothetical protein